jgi:alpha-N-arabinofuranosidase
MTADYYINQYKKYATFMTSYSNTEGLFRIAVGPGTEDFKWTESLMRDIPLKMLDGISIHHYSVINWSKKSHATQFSDEEYFKTIQQAYRMEKMITGNCEVMDKYDPKKKVALVVDEWGGWYESEPNVQGAILFQQNTMRDAMIAGLTLNIFNNHADRVRMANLAQCVNVLQSVILTQHQKMILTPTYHVMEMYKVHQNAVQLPVKINTQQFIRGKDSVDAVTVSASKDKNGALHISLVNVHAVDSQNITISLNGGVYNSVTGRILQSGKIQDYNSFEKPDTIAPKVFNGAKLNPDGLNVVLPPFSVVVLEIK